MNNWNFTGNLGRDAEIRHTPSGDAVVQFSVAVKSGYGEKSQTTWARCSMWGKRGEAVAPYLTKGQQVAVSGEVTLREYEKDGQTRSSLEVRVSDLTLIGKRDAADSQPEQRTAAPVQAAAPHGGFSDFESDIPF